MKTVLKMLFTIFLSALLFACNENSKEGKDKSTGVDSAGIANDKKQIMSRLDSFNIAAAKADYDGYFNCMAGNAIFIGTDPTEYWNKHDFMIWARPYFDKKTTWDFKSIERHIYLGDQKNIAWFDELLNTQMKICRGSGVLVKQGNEWKIQQYVLSATVPNNLVDTVVKMKAAFEDSIISILAKRNNKESL